MLAMPQAPQRARGSDLIKVALVSMQWAGLVRAVSTRHGIPSPRRDRALSDDMAAGSARHQSSYHPGHPRRRQYPKPSGPLLLLASLRNGRLLVLTFPSAAVASRSLRSSTVPQVSRSDLPPRPS